jgi:hypothetical protein
VAAIATKLASLVLTSDPAFAVADRNGVILLRTVFDTERGAKVNWLVVYAGYMVTDFAADAHIAETFAEQSAAAGAQLIRVRVIPEESCPGF